VTGANGFVGSWLVRQLLADGHQVTGLAGRDWNGGILTDAERSRVTWRSLDLEDNASVAAGVDCPADAVVHLAGVASVSETLHDPVRAWRVNTLGTVRLLEALQARRASALTRVLVVSTGEVYGRGERPHTEADPLAPLSPYAASKAAAELAAQEYWRRTGLPVVVARPFPHTGPGQSPRFVAPAFLERLRAALAEGTFVVRTGNLEPVRDFLDVRDVVRAYGLLLERGESGAVYNVASGVGVPLEDLLFRMADLLGHAVRAEPDLALVRPVDIPVLVGDASRLQAATGWLPQFTLDDTLQRMIDAETD
jgi:GDP-4-dehydro-6-deoxy-D-mannose reductase